MKGDIDIMIKKGLFKFASVFMCASVLALSLSACQNNTAAIDGAGNYVCEQTAAENSESTIESIINEQLLGVSGTKQADENEDGKEETVYVFADANGNQSHVVVNEKLKNKSGQKTVSDVSNLKDINNISGDETFTSNGSKLSWAADGNSITYQGTTDEKAPVSIKVTYYLNGKQISADELAGKSGKVKIRFDYTNNLKRSITAGGKTKQAYVPFTMITGMMLSSDNFTNIEVTNGKVVEAAGSNVVLGITMPGLKDSLDLSFDGKTADIDIPEYFEVTADVSDFELDMTMSVAVSNIFSDANLSDINLDDIKSKINTISDAGNQLADGATQLSDGLGQLKGNIPQLTDGIVSLDDGAAALKSGLGQYTQGAASAADGVAQLDSGAAQLAEGINALSDTFRGQLVSGISSLEGGSSELSAGIDKLAEALNGSFAQIKANSEAYGAKYSEALGNAQTLETLAKTDIAGASLNSMLAQLSQAAAGGSIDLSVTPYTDFGGDLTDEAVVSELLTKYMTAYTAAVKLETLSSAGANPDLAQSLSAINSVLSSASSGSYTTVSQLYSSEIGLLLQAVSSGGVYTALDTVYTQAATSKDPDTGMNLTQSLTALSQGAKSLNAGVIQLKQGIGSFDDLNPASETVCSALYKLQAGSSALSGGIKQLGSGLTQLKANNNTLNSGAAQLSLGTSQLRSAAAELGDGVDQLAGGAVTLKDGMVEFNETGIKKLAGFIEDDADDALETVKKVVELGNDYQSFGGKSDDMKGSVKFIYKTEGITK